MFECTCCGFSKEPDEFREVSGYRLSFCRECERKKNNKYNKKRRGKISVHAQWIRSSRKARAKGMLYDIKHRAKKKGLDYDLTSEWLTKKFRNGTCEVTGLPLNFDLSETEVNMTPKALGPSVDRIDPTKGYTMDNCQVVCWMYNRVKGVDSHEAVIKLAKALLRKEGYELTKTS